MCSPENLAPQMKQSDLLGQNLDLSSFFLPAKYKIMIKSYYIQTDLHTKPTDKHQYLLKTSCHPNHTKKAIPSSLFLRIRRICSTETFFDQRSRELIEHLTERGYSRTSLQRDANRVRSIPRHATLQPQEQKSAKTDRTPFVTSFNPALPKISSVVSKYTTLLQATELQKSLP